MRLPERIDVAVIGGGFTGLCAAEVLCEAGLSYVVLEARDRVGGRVESIVNGLGERVDTGGQFLCDDMPEIMALAGKHGKTLKGSSIAGDFVVQPPMMRADGERIYAGSAAIRDRLNDVDPRDPSIADLTVAAWLDGQDDDAEIKAAFRAMIEGLWCLAIERLPLWHLIDNDRRITNEAPELQYFLGETMHALAEDLARGLRSNLHLSMPAQGVEHGPRGVRVTTPAGVVDARAVIVALPPATAAKLIYAPPLPAATAAALSAWESGAVIKVQLRYRSAFWRERGLSGMVMWREPPGLFALDTSPDPVRPMLTFFIGGPLALEMNGHGEAALRREAIDRLVAALGPEAADIQDMVVRNWTGDRWSGGAYSDLIVDIHATDAEETLRKGLPGIAFASSELSLSFPGYIEGAIVAGRAAARQVIAQLASAAVGS